MDIETVITNFETELHKLGLDNDGALLIQLNIGGKNYIRSSGNLNNLILPATIVSDRGNKLIDFMSKEIELSTVKESTKTLHYDSLNLIKEYSPDICLQQITSDYLQKFELYMKQERGLSINTIARHMKSLKRYVNVARKKDVITKYPFLNYTIKTEQAHREALTEKELESLEAYRQELPEQNDVLNAFLFSCYTGLRYSDICIFSKSHIFTVNRKRWIVLRMYKTNKEIRIPLSTIFEGKALQLALSIPRPRGRMFHLESNQQTNRVLNRIAKSIGIKKHITFHTARHTCATLLLYRGVSITTVQTILGHQSVKTTQLYSAVTDMTLEKELKKGNIKAVRRTKFKK